MNFRFKEFLNTAENGVIVFTLGTYLKSNEIPQEKLSEIIETFKNIKQKVLMRVNEDIPDLPPNVMTRRWFTQNEVLAHPKVVLFVSHGEKLTIIIKDYLTFTNFRRFTWSSGSNFSRCTNDCHSVLQYSI